MVLRSAVGIGLVISFSAVLALACECSNNVPIQTTSERYRERAVFTAHVFHLVGRTGNWKGIRYGTLALAVVRKRYWGLPWYWPKVVLLNGSYPCDIPIFDGQDYLVSGWRGRYGVVNVNGCSRTQPLKTAQLDLRTLDGSHCGGPGGSLLGHIDEAPFASTPLHNVPVTLRAQNGATYTARSDRDGIYELRHLPPGDYTLESRIGPHQYEASRNNASVVEEECVDAPTFVREYDFSGLLMPGVSSYVSLKLSKVGASSEQRMRIEVEADGRFYFRNIADGEYLLSATTWESNTRQELYYPGTYDRRKAIHIKVKDHALLSPRSLVFNPDTLPLVPIPVALDPPNASRYSWRVRLRSLNYIVTEAKWTLGDRFVSPFGRRGWPYAVEIYGYSKHPDEYGDCSSQLTKPITAKSRMPIIRMAIPPTCQ